MCHQWPTTSPEHANLRLGLVAVSLTLASCCLFPPLASTCCPGLDGIGAESMFCETRKCFLFFLSFFFSFLYANDKLSIVQVGACLGGGGRVYDLSEIQSVSEIPPDDNREKIEETKLESAFTFLTCVRSLSMSAPALALIPGSRPSFLTATRSPFQSDNNTR
jgi:hypothetical protein